MEPTGEGKTLENPSVPHKKMVLGAAESRERRLCRFTPGHSGGGDCHSARGHSLANPLRRAAAWREGKWSLGWWEFSVHTRRTGGQMGYVTEKLPGGEGSS